jgi:hypothetical protein
LQAVWNVTPNTVAATSRVPQRASTRSPHQTLNASRSTHSCAQTETPGRTAIRRRAARLRPRPSKGLTRDNGQDDRAGSAGRESRKTDRVMKTSAKGMKE